MLFDKDHIIRTHPKEKADLPPPDVTYPFTDDILDFSINHVIEAIDEIKPNASSGPDETSVSLLKNCKEAMAKPIHVIWSISLTSGDVPSLYKFSNVSPLHKKESKALPSNFRPISQTSHIFKFSEKNWAFIWR
jgi:hypothetical protein